MGDRKESQMSPRDRERERDRSRRQTRFSDANSGGDANGRDRSRERRSAGNRIYVSNIPYEYRWQDLKDLCRDIVGDVNFVELFNDESNKPRGCGIVEFKTNDCVGKALEKLNRYEISGRHLVVKEDYGDERDEFGRVVRAGGGGGGGGQGGGGNNNNSSRGGGGNDYRRDRDDDRPRHSSGHGNDYDGPYNTYGLSTSFLEGLGIFGPLHTKVFVANLDYKVDAKKLKQVFKLAGRVVSVDLSTDKDGNSRGFAVVEYDHPVEAVQAISMLDRQMLFDRRMTVRLDRVPDKNEGVKLPDGLKGIGIGLGPNGEPLRDVARNLPSSQQQQNPSQQNNAPVPVAPPNNLNGPSSLLGPVPNSNALSGLSSNLAALSNVVNLSNLSGALSNPLLTSAAANLQSVAGLGLLSENLNQAQSTFNTNTFANSNAFGNSGNTGGGNNQGRGDFDMGGSGPVRNYSTQPQDDFPSRGPASNFGAQTSSNFGGQNTSNLSNLRKSDTIVIKNLPPSCTWQTLRDKFRDIGEVKFAEIRGQDTGVVRFSKERDAELAIKLMDGARFDNQMVYVSFF
uniref:Putative rna-binding protein hnrnp-m n=1 Tax=Nyssomyia neivai TaxID=330878 RepID=A0A1L8DHC4_9DIPT